MAGPIDDDGRRPGQSLPPPLPSLSLVTVPRPARLTAMDRGGAAPGGTGGAHVHQTRSVAAPLCVTGPVLPRPRHWVNRRAVTSGRWRLHVAVLQAEGDCLVNHAAKQTLGTGNAIHCPVRDHQ